MNHNSLVNKKLCPVRRQSRGQNDLHCLTLTERHPEQHESHDEQHDEGADTHIGAAGELASHADDHGAEEGRALAADVEKAKVFARLFRRDDLCKVCTETVFRRSRSCKVGSPSGVARSSP